MSEHGRERLFEKYQDVITQRRDDIRVRDYQPLESRVISCLVSVIFREERADVAWNLADAARAPTSWETRPEIPREYKELKHEIEQVFVLRAEELKKRWEEEHFEENRKAQLREDQERRHEKARITNESKKGRLLYDNNTDMINKFLEIAERKVSILDDYGDENWEALPREVEKCMTKIARQNGLNMMWQKLPARYHWLGEKLTRDFRKYHETQRSVACPVDVSGLSGVNFETFVARRLKENGYEDVRGTPVTGDQGADLIAKKDGRTIIIQAKRYHGTVGNKAVQEVNGAVSFYGGDEGWVITNSTFTSSARALAQKTNVRLFDGKDLERLNEILKNS